MEKTFTAAMVPNLFYRSPRAIDVQQRGPASHDHEYLLAIYPVTRSLLWYINNKFIKSFNFIFDIAVGRGLFQ